MVLEDFTDKVGEEFSVDLAPADPIMLTLDQAEALPARFGPPGGRPPFALTFRGVPDPILPQGVYCLRQVDGADLELFIVPVARTEAATTYRVTFN